MKYSKLIAFFTVAVFAGCGANYTPPIEETAKRINEEILIPTAREVIRSGLASGQLQAGAHAIDPHYVVELEGYWVTGIKGRATVGVEGIAGQVQVASQTPQIPSSQPSNGGLEQVP